MKKKKLNSLKLNKISISYLESSKGGTAPPPPPTFWATCKAPGGHGVC